MAHRLIRFDEEMTSTTQSWSEVWQFLQEYHMTNDEIDRRMRITCLESLLKSIKSCNFDFTRYAKIKENVNISQWMKVEEREEVWVMMIDYLKRVWNEKDDTRLAAILLNDNCLKCNLELPTHDLYVSFCL